MRKVALSGNGFTVDDDPDHALGGFLETALAPSKDHAAVLKSLAQGSEGFAVPGLSGALPVQGSPGDWPNEDEYPGFGQLREPWLVYEEVPGGVTQRIWVEGKELRQLFSDGFALRKKAGIIP